MNKLSIACNRVERQLDAIDQDLLARFDGTFVKGIRHFQQTFGDYQATPLHSLAGLAKACGVANIYVKDEAPRFGLNAFKALGCAYAMGRYLADKFGLDLAKVGFRDLIEAQKASGESQITFVTATDGNHGRAVAWVARQLGQKAVIYMPHGSSPTRLANIRAEGAEASIIDDNYDAAVRLSNTMAQKNGWIVVQDTAWEGYEEVPTWIMQGYCTLVDELFEQLDEQGCALPTHIFLQAGVGSFAGAIAAYFVRRFGAECPTIVVVEPSNADCMYRSSLAGSRTTVGGSLSTIMAGLACGEPSTVGYHVLKGASSAYLSCEDPVAAVGMRILGAPLPGDARVIAGESGAAGLGAAAELLRKPEMRAIRESLGLDAQSRVLAINTEGDTDPDNYWAIVWDGKYGLS